MDGHFLYLLHLLHIFVQLCKTIYNYIKSFIIIYEKFFLMFKKFKFLFYITK